MPAGKHHDFLHLESNPASKRQQNSSSRSPEIEKQFDIKVQLNQIGKCLARTRFQSPYVSSRIIRNRELGASKCILQIRDSVNRDFKPWRSWTGTSKDVLSVAWGQNDYFAVGASTDHVHERDMPYNRSNNLLLGNSGPSFTFLKQLSGHYVRRTKEQSQSDPRHNSPDPSLYMTVSHVLFSQHHRTLYSAGYDNTVRIWDLPASRFSNARCQDVLLHSNKVDLLAQMPTRSDAEPQILATAQHSRQSPISLFAVGSSDSLDESAPSEPMTVFRSARADNHKIFPSSMEWGPDMWTRNNLLVGFAEQSENNNNEKQGHVCIWDVGGGSPEPIKLLSAQDNVFSVAWAPGCKIVAAALAHKNPNNVTYRGLTKSVIRSWSPDESPTWVCEFECPAVDVNDVRFHPTNSTLVTASCTDGRTYVWDSRNQSRILLALEHGDPVEELDHLRRREEQDVGVRFAAWGRDGRFLYTGSSDGRVGCWNILVSPEDALVQEVARLDSGVMAGSFSPDGTKLLLGTGKGSVEILSIGATSGECIEDENLYVASTESAGPFDEYPKTDAGPVQEEEISGIEEAKKLLEDGRLALDPLYGAGQGPKYDGPYEMRCRIPGSSEHVTNFMPNVAACQFDAVTRSEGQRRGGTTTEMAAKCRLEAVVLQKQRQEVHRQNERAGCPARFRSTSCSASPPSSRSLSPASTSPSIIELDDSPPLAYAYIQEDQVKGGAKRPRPIDYRSPLPERKRSRQATPVSASFSGQPSNAVDHETYVSQGFSGSLDGAVSVRPSTPVETRAIDAANVSPRSVKFTPRKQGRNGFIIPPSIQTQPGFDTGSQG